MRGGRTWCFVKAALGVWPTRTCDEIRALRNLKPGT